MEIKKIKNNSKGITLVELLIAIAIFTTVIAIVYSIYIGNIKFINKENIKTQLQNEAQVIDSTFSQLSMQSEGIVDSSLYGTDEFKEVSYIALEYQGKVVKWIVEENILKLQIISNYKLENQKIDSEYNISENVKYFAIKSVDKDDLKSSKIINVKIELEKKKGFSKVNYPFSMMVTFRNKK